MSRKLTDEAIIATLMRTGSVKDAAAELQVTTRTLYNRMKIPAFNAQYAQARDDAVKKASNLLTNRMVASVNAISKIMVDSMNDGDSRTALNAAATLLRYGLQFFEIADIVHRVEALEAMQAERG